MSDPRTWFVAHPIAGDVAGNLASVRRWFDWLVEHCPDDAFAVPWVQYCEALDDGNPEHRARGMRDGIAILRRLDGVILLGGRLSSGMRREGRAARDAGLKVCDLTTIGHKPLLWSFVQDELLRKGGYPDLVSWGLACAASRPATWLDDPQEHAV